MPSKIKVSDLIQRDGDVNQLIEDLKSMRQAVIELREEEIQKASELRKKLKKLHVSQVQEREEIEAAAKAAEEIAKRYKTYNESLSDNAVKIASVKNAQRTLNQVNKLEAKLLTAKKGSYDQLSAQYSLNKIRLNQMSKEERKATEAGQDLVKVTNDIYQEMKQLQEETGKHTLSVGDYAKATEGLVEKLEEMPGALSGAGRGLKSLDAGFKKLAKNPFLFLLAIVISGLIALGNAFKSSEKGARFFEKATATVNALFSNLVELSVKVADGIKFAFENPVQAVKNLGNLIIEQIAYRIAGLINLVVELGTVIGQSLTLNFEEAEEAAKRAGTAIVQIGTGLDSKQQKEFTEAVKEFQKLADARISTQRANRRLTKSVESLTTKEAILRTIADDTTKSFKERENATNDAVDVLQKKNKLEIQIAKNNLRLINQEIDLRRANGENVEQLLDGQLSAYQALSQAEREYTLAVRDNERTRDELKQDRLERDLDILIDGFDNQKTINEKLLDDERLTLEERRKILQKTSNLSDDSFAKQIETIQKFTGIAIDANDLISESDAVALNKKIRTLGLSEIIEGRLLEVIRDRKTANQDLSEAEKELAQVTRTAGLAQLKQLQEIAASDFELTKRNAEEKTIFALQQKQTELEAIKQLNAEFANDLPPIDTAKIEAQIRKLAATLSNARKEVALSNFDEQQQLAQSEFDLLKKTEKEKSEFSLQAEKERLQKIIELNLTFGSNLSDVQIQIMKNQIAAIDNELEKLGTREVNDIYDLFGFKLSDENKSALNESLGYVKQQFSELLQTRVQLAQQSVQQSNDEVAAAQRQLEIEIQNREAGHHHKVATAEKDLAAAKKNQEAALKEQQKAQRAQERIQTIEQSVNLITASAKIWKSFSGLGPFGPFLAGSAIATMFGSFIASKIKARQLSKKTFGKGGLVIVGNGSHASGNDTPIGVEVSGKQAYVEQGEAHAIIPKDKARKYRSVLPALVSSLRKGTFEKNYSSFNGEHGSSGDADIYLSNSSSSSGDIDVSNMERSLEAIEQNSHRSSSVNAKGQDVVRYKNLTQTYV